MKQVKLSDEALDALNKPLDGQGGWQDFMQKLQGQCQQGTLSYDDDDFERIKRCADGKGGYQNRFKKILSCIYNT